jgi:hypothetical protein
MRRVLVAFGVVFALLAAVAAQASPYRLRSGDTIAISVYQDSKLDRQMIVGPDGSIPADQIARLGLRPGAHLRVVGEPSPERQTRFGGSLPDLPDLSWEGFERGSALARGDMRVS